MTSEQTGTRTNVLLVIGAALLIVGFLIGFVWQHGRASRFQDAAGENEKRIEQLQHEATLSRARDLAGLLCLELARKNYGTAAQSATAFFNHIRSVIAGEANADIKSGLEGILAQRDVIVAKIAKSDSTVETDGLNILSRLFQLTFKP